MESQIKCVATGHHAYAFREGFQNMGDRGEVIVILKMWRSIDILPEVEEFRQSLLRSDLMFRNMGYKAFVNLVVLIVLYLRICLKLVSLL
ncbi:hypothetical protein YC2023_071035 [Brassica napus]